MIHAPNPFCSSYRRQYIRRQTAAAYVKLPYTIGFRSTPKYGYDLPIEVISIHYANSALTS